MLPQKKQELGCFEHLEFIPQPFSVPPVHFVRPAPCRKIEKSQKKKNPKFFSQVFLRPAHYTLCTLLGPKSQKKQELSCFEHLEFIPRPFFCTTSAFCMGQRLVKKSKNLKKKIFFFGKISTPGLRNRRHSCAKMKSVFDPKSGWVGHNLLQIWPKIGIFLKISLCPAKILVFLKNFPKNMLYPL